MAFYSIGFTESESDLFSSLFSVKHTGSGSVYFDETTLYFGATASDAAFIVSKDALDLPVDITVRCKSSSGVTAAAFIGIYQAAAQIDPMTTSAGLPMLRCEYAISSAGRKIMARTADGTLRYWNFSTGEWQTSTNTNLTPNPMSWHRARIRIDEQRNADVTVYDDTGVVVHQTTSIGPLLDDDNPLWLVIGDWTTGDAGSAYGEVDWIEDAYTLPTPSNVSVWEDGGAVYASWDPVAGASSYLVEASVNGVPLAPIATAETTVLIDSVASGAYAVSVHASNDRGTTYDAGEAAAESSARSLSPVVVPSFPWRPLRTARGIDLGAAAVDVTARTAPLTLSGSGADRIAIVGLLPGPHRTWDAIPFLGASSIVEELGGGRSDAAAVAAVLGTRAVQEAIACSQAGGKEVWLVKAGPSAASLLEDADAAKAAAHRLVMRAVEHVAGSGQFGVVVVSDVDAEGAWIDACDVPVFADDGSIVHDGDEPVYEHVDAGFLDPLGETAQICADALADGVFIEAFLSTASRDGTIWLSSESLRRKEAWQAESCYGVDGALDPRNDRYRFVAVPAGRVIVSVPGFDRSFEVGAAPIAAGLASTLDESTSCTGRMVPVQLVTSTDDDAVLDLASRAGYMPLRMTKRSQRGLESYATFVGDNTMAVDGSDYKHEAVLRLARRVAWAVQEAADGAIGRKAEHVMAAIAGAVGRLDRTMAVKRISFMASLDPGDATKLRVVVVVEPFLPVRRIEISVIAGPVAW